MSPLLLAFPLLALSAGPSGPDWTALQDLQGRAVPAPVPPAVVVLVTARRARELRSWEQRLLQLQPPPRILRVVEVPPDGNAAEVARRLRQRVPEGVTVALDGARSISGALGVDAREPQVLVLDAQGRVAARIQGRASDAADAAVRRAWAAAVKAR